MKKGMLGKIVSLTVAMAMSATLLAGCGSSSSASTAASASAGTSAAASTAVSAADSASGSSGTINLDLWWLSTRQEGTDPIVEAFNASQDKIKVTASYYDTDGIKDACKVAAQSGTLPDMWFNWGGSLGSYYVENGCTYDMTQYAKDNNWSDKFTSGVTTLCTLDGQLCGYPTSYNVIGMFYNKAIFEKYNLSVPTTFDEFEQVCATLKQNGITPISTGGLYGWHPMRLLEQFIEYYAGADLHDQLNTFATSWDCDAVQKALAKFKEFCDKGYFPDGWNTADPNDTYMALASGTAAMDIQGQWYDGTLTTNEIDPNEYGWFAFPNGTGRMSAFAEMTQFNKNLTDDELAACIQFEDYFYNKDNIANYGDWMNLPVPTVDADMPDTATSPHVADMINTSNKDGIFTITDQAFPTEVADVLFDDQTALDNGSITPEAASANIQAAIESYLSGSTGSTSS